MERSFRSSELRQRAMGTISNDREDDLMLFVEMRKREKERSNLPLHNPDEHDQPLESHSGASPTSKFLRSTLRKTAVDDLLNSDSEKGDYDWLLTPPGTPIFPFLEKEPYRYPLGDRGISNGHPTLLKSRLTYPAEPTSRNMATSRQSAPSSSFNSSLSGLRRPSSSGGSSVTSSRPATPTGRQMLPTALKLPRSSAPSSNPTLPPKSMAPQRRSPTPVRSSTPTSRPSVPPTGKLTSRSNTPTRRPTTPSGLLAGSAPSIRSSPITKSRSVTSPITMPSTSRPGPATSSVRSGATNSMQRPILLNNPIPKSSLPVSKIPAPSRGTSPTVRSRPWKPSEMPGYSLEAPPNLKTTLDGRSSPCRGRPGPPSIRSSSVENAPIARPRRQSCSPSRGGAPKGNAVSGSSVPASNRSGLNGGESPAVMGSKMVKRVVNSRRLAPPMHAGLHSSNISSVKKSSLSPDSTGFGRTLSKKSLDMAMRHMDIRRSIPNTLRPLMSNVPSSSLYSVRPGFTRGRSVSVSGSPLATSSNASSELSVSNGAFCSDGNEIEHDSRSSEKEGGRAAPSFLVAR